MKRRFTSTAVVGQTLPFKFLSVCFGTLLGFSTQSFAAEPVSASEFLDAIGAAPVEEAVTPVQEYAGPAPTDGPFGVVIGSDVSLLEGCSDSGDDVFICTKLPKIHSAFGLYAVKASPSQGICWVKAAGNPQRDDSHGLKTQVAVTEIAEQVALTYGAHTSHVDRLSGNSIWTESNDWMMAVKRGDRTYRYHWNPEQGFKPKNRVTEIFAYAEAYDSSSGTVMLEFYGDNYEACTKELSDAKASAF